MTTPNIHAITTGSTFTAGDINQFLGTQALAMLYQGASQVSYTAAATGSQNLNQGGAATWLAQPFTTTSGQTTITRVELLVQGNTGGADTTLELRTDSVGSPSNTALWTCTLPADFQPSSAAYISIPCNVTGLSASTQYHIVLDGTASGTSFGSWSTAATSGSAGLKSSSGTGSWSSVGATFLFNVFNGANGVHRNIAIGGPPPLAWMGMDYTNSTRDGNSVVVTLREYVSGTVRSVRTLSYSSGALTGVA